MTFVPLDTDLIAEHLRESVPEFQQVGQAADYAAVKSLRDLRPPSAYVVLAQEKGDSDPSADRQARSSGRQRVECTFGVILGLRNFRDNLGHAASEDARPLIGRLREALMGWTPGLGQFREIRWRQAEVLDYDADMLLWMEVFSTHRFIGGNAP